MKRKAYQIYLQSSVLNQKCYRCQWQEDPTKYARKVLLEIKSVTDINERRPYKISLQSFVRNQKCYICQWKEELTKYTCKVLLEIKSVTDVNDKKTLRNLPANFC